MENLVLDLAKADRLGAVLGSLTPDMALRLARAVESDRLNGGVLPHDAILAGLRPRLREAEERLKRVSSPKRLVCNAFEDLLIEREGAPKQRGRIDRASIDPVWRWLTEDLEPEAWAAAEDDIRGKLLSGGIEFTAERVAEFQATAAAAILRALPSTAPDDARAAPAIKRLGVMIAADAHDMARMLAIGPLIRRLQNQLAKPIAALSDYDLETIRGIWLEAQDGHADNAVYIGFFVLGRLERPWEVLRLAGRLSGKIDDILISRTDVGELGELIFSDLELCVGKLAPLRSDSYEADLALAQIAAFATTSTGVVRELGIRRDGPWGKRLMAARGGIAAEAERLLERAPKAISAALPMSRRAGLSLNARRTPDFSRLLDAVKARRATEAAKLVAGARPYAMAGAFAGLLSTVEEQVTDLLRQYSLEMLDELREIDAAQRERADGFTSLAVELTRILLGAEEAELMRRRVVAAQALSGTPTLAA